MALIFDRAFDAPAGVPMALSPRVARLLAPNPGPYTFKGTGVYIVGAGESVAVIDPGPDLPAHLEALKRALDARRVSHILITHTHRDHSPAAAALKAFSGARTHAFAFTPPAHILSAQLEETQESFDGDFTPDVTLEDGAVIAGEGFTLTVLHTPGHVGGHLCFALEEEKALFTGDHVMGWATSVIAPPEGDMAAYMQSLERVIARDDRVLYPTHGAPVTAPGPYLRALLAHRRAREAQVQDCLARGIGEIEAMTAALYPGLDASLHPAAALTLQAHLLKLEDEGWAVRTARGWRPNLAGP